MEILANVIGMQSTDEGSSILFGSMIYACVFFVLSKSFNLKVSTLKILAVGCVSGFLSLALYKVYQVLLLFTIGMVLGLLQAVGIVERSTADLGTIFLDRVAFWVGSVGTGAVLLWVWGIKGECYSSSFEVENKLKFGYSNSTKKLGIYLAWIVFPILTVIAILQTIDYKEFKKTKNNDKSYLMKK